MEETFIYRQIAESIRRQILTGEIKPGDRLPSVREMTSHWNCTIGTIQRAYQELASQGLITSRAGQGTRVVDKIPEQNDTPLRRLAILHRAETFLLEVLTAGYSPTEVEDALRLALDRWRAVSEEPSPTAPNSIRFTGSHDMAITWLASHFPEIAPGYSLQLHFSGSMGGLVALLEGKCDIAGAHLWDAETQSYNLPYVQKLMPGKRIAIIHLAERQLGLILQPGNPKAINGLSDLSQPDLHFINRQSGSGTRVWLDSSLKKLEVDITKISGYDIEMNTHSEIAMTIAQGKADVGVGLEASARLYGLDFIPLTREQYDLIFYAADLEKPPINKLVTWLKSPAAKKAFLGLAGYQTQNTGQMILTE